MTKATKNRSGRIAVLRERISEMHAAGMSRGAISDALRISPQSVSYHTKAMGLIFGRKVYRRTPDLQQKIAELSRSGMTPRQISEVVCIVPHAVRRHLRVMARAVE